VVIINRLKRSGNHETRGGVGGWVIKTMPERASDEQPVE